MNGRTTFSLPLAIQRAFDAFRRGRKALKALLPYVRRREYRILRNRHDALIDAFTVDSRLATEAALLSVKSLDPLLAGEICLFVTHAKEPVIKPHVQAHIDALANEGFQVVLIVNTDIEAQHIVLEAPLLNRLAACLVRGNVGFDFGGWGHAYAIGKGFPNGSRLLLVNDSIIGPLDKEAFGAMISRLRNSSADIAGLTENAVPHRHLQSYFLSFGPRALRSAALQRAFSGLRALPTKELVIDAYETALTRQLERSGLTVSALFPPLYNDPRSADNTLIRWRALIDAGFPYVKASLLTSPKHREAVQSLLPPELYLRPENESRMVLQINKSGTKAP